MTATKPTETPNPGRATTPLENNPMQGAPEGTPWDLEWAAERAAEAMRYLAEHYPECAGSERLHPHQEAAHEAAVSGDRDAYLEALRRYMRTGRGVAVQARLRARKGAA